MRVRVILDFDIVIESLISLCIIETVGAICGEYKPWIVRNFVFCSYFVVIFRVGVDVFYRRAIRTSGILPVKSFSQPRTYKASYHS
jgi:hypothetical protein